MPTRCFKVKIQIQKIYTHTGRCIRSVMDGTWSTCSISKTSGFQTVAMNLLNTAAEQGFPVEPHQLRPTPVILQFSLV